jgi:cytochrome c biogenesis protein ResB
VPLKVKIRGHPFRAKGITAYLEAGGTLENAQMMAAHESSLTTKLYDRTKERLTQHEKEFVYLGLVSSPIRPARIRRASQVMKLVFETCYQ